MASQSVEHNADLTNCDEEPIHLIGAVQLHGYFCAFQPESKTICTISENFAAQFGKDPNSLIGQPASALLDKAGTGKIETLFDQRESPISFEVRLNKKYFWAHPYWTEGLLAIDLEPAGKEELVNNAVLKATAAIKELRLVDSTEALVAKFTEAAQNVLGFDRTMVYRFDQDFNGTVIAELCSSAVDHSFMGLTFPHSDIPAQARALFLRNRVRTISSVTYESAGIYPQLNPLTKKALDLSDSVIRSVSPIHIEYLQNMGVQASLTISLLDGDRLWGLIACHHYQSEKYVPPRIRNACLMMCETFSLSLAEIEAKRRSASLTRKLRKVSELYEHNLGVDHTDMHDLLQNMEADIVDILDADGVQLRIEDVQVEFGVLPESDDLSQFCSALSKNHSQASRQAIFSNHLQALNLEPSADCAGVLYYQLPANQGHVLAIRKEQPQAISWAGDPDKKIIADPDTRRLHPRRSFELFQEMQRGRSAEWAPEIGDIAPDLVNTLFKIVIMASRRLEQERRLKLQRQVTVIKEKAAHEIAEQSKEKRLLSERLSLATLAGNIGVWEWDIQSGEVEWDERMYQLYGFETKPGKMTYDSWLNMLHPEDMQTTEQGLQEAMANSDEFHSTFRIKTPDHELRYIHAHGLLERDENGKPLRMTGVNWDDTENRESEIRLEKLVEELGASNSELERFAYVASHDLKEPLRMVTSFTKLIDQRYRDQLDDTGREYIKFSVEAARRMQELIDDLLEYARLDHETERLLLVDLEKLFVYVEQSLEELVQSENAKLTHDPLPQVLGNKVRLTRLLQNLVENAIKYHKPDTLPEVHVSATQDAGYWVFSVKDNGIGIAAKHQQQIFLPFKRLHGREEYRGTGIGLAICKKIVEGHGGRLWVDSTPGQGSVFYFSIPVWQEEQPDDQSHNETKGTPG